MTLVLLDVSSVSLFFWSFCFQGCWQCSRCCHLRIARVVSHHGHPYHGVFFLLQVPTRSIVVSICLEAASGTGPTIVITASTVAIVLPSTLPSPPPHPKVAPTTTPTCKTPTTIVSVTVSPFTRLSRLRLRSFPEMARRWPPQST